MTADEWFTRAPPHRIPERDIFRLLTMSSVCIIPRWSYIWAGMRLPPPRAVVSWRPADDNVYCTLLYYHIIIPIDFDIKK